jgi:hypothetical protein
MRSSQKQGWTPMPSNAEQQLRGNIMNQRQVRNKTRWNCAPQD